MSKSLAELRQSPATSAPERSYRLCLAAGLVAEVQSLTEELAAIAVPPRTDEDEPAAPPKRMAEGGESPREAEIKQRLRELWDEMEEHTGELRLRAVDSGAWRRWVDAHPAREDNARDARIAYGACNGDDLIDDLATYAHSWNGDPLAEGDWEFIRSKASGGDLQALAQAVVMMHEVAPDLPKLRRVSLDSL